jgi:hypothetical protein
MSEIEVTLAQIKQSIDRIGKEVAQRRIPSPLLTDFKLSVDQVRLTIWAMMMYEEESAAKSSSVQFGVSTRLVEFRIKRVLQMLAELREDIEGGRVPSANPELRNLASALQATLQAISKLQAGAA